MCTRTYTSSQNEFLPVQWLKRSWKTELWKIWLRRKGKKMTQCRSVADGENTPGGGRGRRFQEHRTTGQAANVDDIRRLHSFVGTNL
jgi:hypothetical protein